MDFFFSDRYDPDPPPPKGTKPEDIIPLAIRLKDFTTNWYFRAEMAKDRNFLLSLHSSRQFIDITDKWLYENLILRDKKAMKGFFKFIKTKQACFVETIAVTYDGYRMRPMLQHYDDACNLVKLRQFSLSLNQNDDTWLRRWSLFLQKLPVPLERLELRPKRTQVFVRENAF